MRWLSPSRNNSPNTSRERNNEIKLLSPPLHHPPASTTCSVVYFSLTTHPSRFALLLQIHSHSLKLLPQHAYVVERLLPVTSPSAASVSRPRPPPAAGVEELCGIAYKRYVSTTKRDSLHRHTPPRGISFSNFTVVVSMMICEVSCTQDSCPVYLSHEYEP